MQAYLAEFIGTMILIILGDGVVAGVLLKNSKAENSGWIVITVGWAMAVTVAVYCVGQFSGAHINPAVTIGLAATGQFEWLMVPGYIIAQLLGALVGAVIVWLAYLPHWAPTEDAGLKLGVFSTAPAYRATGPNLITEIIGTAVLLFGVLGIGANAGAVGGDLSAVIATGLNPLLVGLLVLGIGLSLGGPTGYAINPARDLGPRIAHAILPIAGKGSSDWEYSWIPIVGPIIGGIIGAALFVLLGFGG
ncbi:MAG: Glycerol uptake facilitator protein [uncultured Rubrobacteraceae bacterium]|uniref:Glycerol uptake facilitator protein n=1 Tax=uncultured Rubrobacteraceae bacterium TaxID=349277 RepID=A0A6J4P9F9_9ACTN|nr:MAG: Glycerol uptake facilitator protein [uncultured Rubrobacteraceae bacterium]